MAKRIFFMRSAPYDYSLKGFDLYDSFDRVARGEADPGINPTTIKISMSNAAVLCADDKRCFSTARLICARPTRSKLLSEIGYSMDQVMPKDEFFGKGSRPEIERARKGFIDALVGDRVNERYGDIMARIRSLFRLLKAAEGDDVVAVSHGFLMKAVEAYAKDGSIEREPKKIRNHFDESSIAFGFLEGFTLNLEGEAPEFLYHTTFDPKSNSIVRKY
jgi:broad specificity phosphatase PhoE